MEWILHKKKTYEGLANYSFMKLFEQFGKKRNQRLFENKERSIHILKSLFLNNLFLWVKLYIGEGLMSLIDFVDWLDSCLREN